MVAPLNVRVYVACSTLLYTKFLVMTLIQGGITFKSGGRPPEDSKLSLAKGHPPQNYGLSEEKDEKILKMRALEVRWRRMIMNDLESVPFALGVFASGVLAHANENVFAASMITYTIARIVHSYVYQKQKQPHRAIAWFVAVLSLLTGGGNAIVAAFF